MDLVTQEEMAFRLAQAEQFRPPRVGRTEGDPFHEPKGAIPRRVSCELGGKCEKEFPQSRFFEEVPQEVRTSFHEHAADWDLGT
jgi:hypothetical protein